MYKTAIITYTYGNGLISDSRKEAKGSDTEKRYYHYNHIGSTTAITDADGDLLYRIAYGTYGELTGIYDADGQKMAGEAAGQSSIRETLQAEKLRFLYNGRYGVETGADGLYYMRARYYNPQIKRFINRDIIDGSITDSQSLNKYSYVQGNPISLVDPFGLCAQDYFSRAGHELLDWLGFIFDPADVINFLWYTAEGNAAMAAATAVAIVPAAGSFIAKGTKQAIKAGKKAAQKAGEKAAKNATEKAAKKAAKKKLAKEAGKEAAQKGAEKAAKEAAEKATEKTAKETAEKTAKEAAEKGIKTSYGKSREIIQCNTKDAAADELAKRIGGQSRSAFADDPIQREFDVISDQYIAQAKPPLKCVNKTVRTQMKATFEAAKKYERKVYYQFEGIPSQEVLDKLYEYSERYGVEVIIDTEPLGILN